MVEQDSPSTVGLDQVARIVSSYARHHQIDPGQLEGLIVTVHRALAGLGRGVLPVQIRCRRRCRSSDRCSPSMSSASSVDFAGERCAAICGYSTGSRSPLIGPGEICRRITR